MRDTTLEIDTGHEPFELRNPLPPSETMTPPFAVAYGPTVSASLTEVTFEEVITVYRNSRSCMRIAVRGAGGRVGEVAIVDGRVVEAHWETMKGRLALCAMRDLSAAEIVALPMPGWARAAYASYPELEPDIRPFRSVPEVREPSSARERRTSELPTAIGQVAPWVHALAELDPSSDTVETPKGDRPDFVCVERDIALAAWTAMERMPEAFRLAAQHVSLVVFGAQGTVGLHVGGRRVRAPEVAGLVGWLRSAMSKGPFELRTPSLVVVGHAEGQTCVAAIATTAEGERTAKSVVAAYLLCLLGALEELRATR